MCAYKSSHKEITEISKTRHAIRPLEFCSLLPHLVIYLKENKRLTVVHQEGGIPGERQLGIGEGGVRGVLRRRSIAQTRGLLVQGMLVGVLGAVPMTG